MDLTLSVGTVGVAGLPGQTENFKIRPGEPMPIGGGWAPNLGDPRLGPAVAIRIDNKSPTSPCCPILRKLKVFFGK